MSLARANPFIVGSEADEGNWFYEFVKRHEDKIQCYLLNTGGVGERREEGKDGNKILKQAVLRVEIPEMAAIIRGIVRNAVEWEPDPYFGTMVPRKVNGVYMKKFDLSNFYSQDQIEAYVKKLKEERISWLNGFEGLNPEIIKAFKL